MVIMLDETLVQRIQEADRIGARELVECVEAIVLQFDRKTIVSALHQTDRVKSHDLLIYADLLLVLGGRDEAFCLHENWLKDESQISSQDLVPLVRFCAYAGANLRTLVASEIIPFQDKRDLSFLLSRSASASIGDWPACLDCHLPNLFEPSTISSQITHRLIGLSAISHYNMVLYEEAVLIAKLLPSEHKDWLLTDGRYRVLSEMMSDAIARARRYVTIMEECELRQEADPEPQRRQAEVDLTKVDIFIKTYPGDQGWLEWCLRSIARFAVGFRRVVIVSDLGHGFATDIIPEYAYFEIASPAVVAPFGNRPGYLMQQVVKLDWCKYTDADAVMMLDSDTMLVKQISPADLIIDRHPQWQYGQWDIFGGKKWRPGSRLVVGSPCEHSYMKEHPFLLTRVATEAFHSHIQRRFGRPIGELYFDDDVPVLISEFECFGTFLGEIDNCGYCLDEILVPKGFVLQHWSWGGLNAQIEELLESIIGSCATTSSAEKKRQKMEYKNLTIEQRSKLDALGEMELFRAAELWDGGYIDGDPLVPVGWSSYSTTGFISVYHATYLACIKPYVNADTVALEIGPGRGAWTKSILTCGAKHIYALDVQKRETNVIDQVLGELSARMDYIVVSDFSGDGVPDNSVDFFWSFGTFVHLSRGQQKAYYETLARTMKPGARGFVQIADIPTWNRVVTTFEYHIHHVLSDRLASADAEQMREILSRSPIIAPRETVAEDIENYEIPDPGRYFYVGLDWVSAMLEKNGFEIVERSVFDTLRDPVLHFRKK